MSDSMDGDGGRRSSIEFLPENLSVGRELAPSDAISQIGEKTGMNDKHVKDMFPGITDSSIRIHFENIKNGQNRTIGVFVVGTRNGEEVFRYKLLYIGGKYVKTDK